MKSAITLLILLTIAVFAAGCNKPSTEPDPKTMSPQEQQLRKEKAG
jgi:hypothetical protein